MYKFKRDTYSSNRGGHSRILNVSCEHCSCHVAYYQKDGPGQLLRMYIDRFIDVCPNGARLLCYSCGRVLGTRIVYQKEARPAYRLYAGAVTKRLTSQNSI